MSERVVLVGITFAGLALTADHPPRWWAYLAIGGLAAGFAILLYSLFHPGPPRNGGGGTRPSSPPPEDGPPRTRTFAGRDTEWDVEDVDSTADDLTDLERGSFKGKQIKHKPDGER